MARYQCSVCGYVYDESKGGSPWNKLADNWTCPVCGSAKSAFTLEGSQDAGSEETLGFSAALARVHRVFGYVYLGLYLILLWEMIPRLWNYQIEFPARSVVHLSLGMAIGAILFVKIAIVRFFRRLETTLVPLLGTSLLVGTVVMIGLSAPYALHEALRDRAATDGGVFSPANLERVSTLLVQAGLEDQTARERLATVESLRAGRRVLRQECVECHDLRTVLARPRTPANWRQTVRRMADRTTAMDPIDEPEQWQVTAYLIALSPRLRQSASSVRDQRESVDQAKRAAQSVVERGGVAPGYDPASAKRLFEAKCSQCHDPKLIETARPNSENEVRQLVAQMVEEGLEASEAELEQIVGHLTKTYVKQPDEQSGVREEGTP